MCLIGFGIEHCKSSNTAYPMSTYLSYLPHFLRHIYHSLHYLANYTLLVSNGALFDLHEVHYSHFNTCTPDARDGNGCTKKKKNP